MACLETQHIDLLKITTAAGDHHFCNLQDSGGTFQPGVIPGPTQPVQGSHWPPAQTQPSCAHRNNGLQMTSWTSFWPPFPPRWATSLALHHRKAAHPLSIPEAVQPVFLGSTSRAVFLTWVQTAQKSAKPNGQTKNHSLFGESPSAHCCSVCFLPAGAAESLALCFLCHMVHCELVYILIKLNMCTNLA